GLPGLHWPKTGWAPQAFACISRQNQTHTPLFRAQDFLDYKTDWQRESEFNALNAQPHSTYFCDAGRCSKIALSFGYQLIRSFF
ncbi:MAG: hypothetical protein VW683_12880, partial [Betaproteobacteria bacterium]